MADITRDQFDETKAVTKKILQKGVYVADADWNEAQDIRRYAERRALSCLVEHANKRFGDGFKVVGTGASLAVTVDAGFGAFLIGAQLAILLQLAENATVSGFTAWTAARTDYVYLDITEAEISAAEDADIVNPDIGEETCRDLRLAYTFAISEGAVPGAAPSGHTYISLASITKTTGSTIAAEDVTLLVDKYGADYSNLSVGTLTVTTGLVLFDDAIHMGHLHSDVAAEGLAQNTNGSLKVDGVVEGEGGHELKKVVIEIGDWNMDASSSTIRTYAPPLLSTIRSVQVFIRKDAGEAVQALYPLGQWLDSGVPAGGFNLIDTGGGIVQYQLFRINGSMFDSTAFDQTSYNRGWITVEYEA